MVNDPEKNFLVGWFKNLKIRSKIIGGFLIVITVLIYVFYVANQQFQNRDVDTMATIKITHIKDLFLNFQKSDTDMMSSVLEVITSDIDIKNIYLKKDREGLYFHNEELFNNLKNKHGITHWYFISTDGYVFLRMEDKDLYGDVIKDNVFLKALTSQKTSSGLELGNNGYILNVITPYMDNGKIIGYVGLGEEIDRFLESLKKSYDEEFFIATDKNFLNKKDWISARTSAGLRNNWEDLTKYLFISSTVDELNIKKIPIEPENNWLDNLKKYLFIFKKSDPETTRACSVEDDFKRLEKGSVALGPLGDGDVFRCAGFNFADAGGNYSGIVLTTIGITEQIATVKENNKEIGVISLIFFLISLFISFLISRPIIDSIKNLSQVTKDIATGNLGKRVEIKSKDELGILAENFNAMTDNLVESLQETRVILETMPEPLLVLDKEGIITVTNEATYSMLKYEKGTLIGKQISEIIAQGEENK